MRGGGRGWGKHRMGTTMPMHPDIKAYNDKQSPSDREICDLLASEIEKALPKAENKVWHGAPVWFLDGNPIVGYHKLKSCVRLLFWSGASFDEDGLQKEGGFKTAGVRYNVPSPLGEGKGGGATTQVDLKALKRWLKKSREIQWDYKNIVKRKGKLVRLK